MAQRLIRIAYECVDCGRRKGESYLIFPWQKKYQPTHELATCVSCGAERKFQQVEVGA